MTPIRVLVVDDQRLIRIGVRALLEQMDGVELAGEAEDGRSALALMARDRPGLVLLDIGMPGMNGLEVAARAAEQFPDVRVIILSACATEQSVGEALRAGAAGYLLKESTPDELEDAIRTVAGGGSYLSPAVSRQVVAAYRQLPGAPAGHLTPRQREVLRLVGEGKTSKEIARALGIGVRTVETHRSQLMARLDTRSVAGLVHHAARAGLVDLGCEPTNG